MLRFYNIFKSGFLWAFRLKIHWWRGFLGCFSVSILCWRKNNLMKSVTFCKRLINYFTDISSFNRSADTFCLLPSRVWTCGTMYYIPHLPCLGCSGEMRKSRLLGWRLDVQRKRLNSLAWYAMMLATWKECIYSGFNILNRMSVLLLITFVGGTLCCR